MAQPEKRNRFKNSKVYKITCNVTGLIYVGSTTQELHKRLQHHKACYKRYLDGKFHFLTSFKVLENNDYDIHLINSYDFDNKIDLLSKENHYIKKLKCVNKNVAGRTQAEYRTDNKEKIKEYYQDNKDDLKEKHKIYNQQNKIQISARKKTICVCSCGCSYKKCDKARHQRSNKHIKLAAINAIQIV